MKNQLLRNMPVAIAMLFIMMFTMPSVAEAQTEYKLWIATSKSSRSIAVTSLSSMVSVGQ